MTEVAFSFPNPAIFTAASTKSHLKAIILDPKSFAVLGTTVQAGLNLPENVAEYQERFNRKAFEVTLARDMGVYDMSILKIYAVSKALGDSNLWSGH
jgi:hypothetical protein